MAERTGDYGREVRDTIVKSGLTGVAATVIAVAAFSPVGIGGLVGTSSASGLGGETGVAPADDPYAKLPAFPAPLTTEELENIRGELARTAASLEITRAATEARIERIRALADRSGVETRFAPVPDEIPTATIGGGLRVGANNAGSQPGLVPASYTGGGGGDEYRASHNDLADLMFAHEKF